MVKKTALAAVSAILFSVNIFAAKVTTVGDFRLMAGQYFYNMAPSSLSGNMSFTIAPSIKVDDKLSIIPSLASAYKGTKEVTELAGGGTLFQDSFSNILSLKGIYAINGNLKARLGASYKSELLRETKDESYANGLFNYNKINYGTEIEFQYYPKQYVRAGFDQFTLAFPNYQSLESSSTEHGREFAGKDRLNCNNMMMSAKFINALGKVGTELGYSSILKNFTDQYVLQPDSTFSSAKRADSFSMINLSLSYPFKILNTVGMVAGVGCISITNDSNQAHEDSKKPYLANYYDYTQLVINPSLNFLLGSKPWILSLSGMMGTKNYSDRPAQDENGNYSDTEKIYVNEYIVSMGVVYPISKEFKLRLSGNYIKDSSNTKYTAVYSYSYESTNYLMGFSYEF